MARLSSIEVEHNGKKQDLRAWADELGLSYQTVYARLYRYFWEPEKALTAGNQRPRKAKNDSHVPAN